MCDGLSYTAIKSVNTLNLLINRIKWYIEESNAN